MERPPWFHKMDRKPIEFDLIGNAKDSFRQAVELLAHGEIGSDHARFKHAIVSSAHCIELMLKERLRRIHPAFIWERVESYPQLTAKTVTVDQAVLRLKSIGNVVFSADDDEVIKAVRVTRNAIEHYEWRTSEDEAKVIIGNAVSFGLAFAERELGIDLAEQFKHDDTWTAFIDELFEFAVAHGKRMERVLAAAGTPAIPCNMCGSVTVSLGSETCYVCGHWQSTGASDE
jgi:hypothetical protein